MDTLITVSTDCALILLGRHKPSSTKALIFVTSLVQARSQDLEKGGGLF